MDQVDLTGDGPASPAPRAARRSSAGGTTRPRASVDLSNEDDGSTAVVKRSLRIAALEGKAQQKAAEEELEKEKGQQMVLHQRIASLLKKVEYMDRKRSDAEDKLREEKKKKAGAGGAEKDKEITKLKRQLAKAGSSGGSPKKLEQQVKQLQAKLQARVHRWSSSGSTIWRRRSDASACVSMMCAVAMYPSRPRAAPCT